MSLTDLLGMILRTVFSKEMLLIFLSVVISLRANEKWKIEKANAKGKELSTIVRITIITIVEFAVAIMLLSAAVAIVAGVVGIE